MKNIILDCDPGHDDAIALMLALSKKDFNILTIITESGNQTIEKTTRNAINVCEYLNDSRKDISIVKGTNRPLVKDIEICSDIHGESGLDGFTFPKYDKKPLNVNGIEYLVKTILDNDNVIIVTTGPVTNIALAIRLEPLILDHIDRIVMMGGSVDNGNVTPSSEFNVLCDPEAFDIVINSGAKVYMIGLNCTRKVLVLPEIIERMEKINNKASELFTKLMIVFNQNQYRTFGLKCGPLHDPVTIVTLIDESIVKYDYMNVTIDLSHGCSYGRTNCDVFHYSKLKSNCYVAVDIDVEKYWDCIEEGIRSYSK